MEMLSAFTAVLHVPNLSESKHLLTVLEESDAFSKQEIQQIARAVDGRRYCYFLDFIFCVLLDLTIDYLPCPQSVHRYCKVAGIDRFGPANRGRLQSSKVFVKIRGGGRHRAPRLGLPCAPNPLACLSSTTTYRLLVLLETTGRSGLRLPT